MFVRMLAVLTLASMASADQTNSTFRVIWNVPSLACASFNVTIDPAQYGFTVNSGNTFLGDQIALLYNPGLFPEILADGTRVNGGIPQLGELEPHLKKLSADLQRSIPNVNFSGLAVIDFESWTPWFTEAKPEYRDAALELVRGEHPNWSEERIEEQAREDWEWSARLFLEQTLMAAEAARPTAIWGYYQYPLCENLHITNGTCSQAIRERNDHLSWLLGDSRALYPSIYLFLNGFTNADRHATVAGRLDEALRHADDLPILPYTWFQYHDDESYLSDEDLQTMLGEPAARGMAGAIMWGATANCNSAAQCRRLEEYLREHLGPVVHSLVELTPADTDRPEKGLQALFTEVKWLAGAAEITFSNDSDEIDYRRDGHQEITGSDGASKMKYRRLEMMRKWQSSLDHQLWEMKRTRERSSISGEPGTAA